MSFLSSIYAKLAGVALVVALVGGAYWHYTSLRESLTEARTELSEANRTIDTLEASIAAERAALAARDDIVANNEAQEEEARVQTEEALSNNVEWSTAPVPRDVLDSLRD